MKKTFISKKLNKEVILSETQQKALDNLCSMNFHCEARVALAELFHAPKYIKNVFRNILTISRLNGLEYGMIQSRIKYTAKLNNFIKRNYGVKAYKFAISIQ